MAKLRIGIERQAPEGEPFAPDAFVDQVDMFVPVEVYGQSFGMGLVLKVSVREDGMVATFALAADDTPELRAALAAGKY